MCIRDRSWINTASATDPGTTETGDHRIVSGLVPTASAGVPHNIVDYRVAPSVTTTYYLGFDMTFSGGSNASAFGRISANRAAPYLTGYTAIVTGILWGG